MRMYKVVACYTTGQQLTVGYTTTRDDAYELISRSTGGRAFEHVQYWLIEFTEMPAGYLIWREDSDGFRYIFSDPYPTSYAALAVRSNLIRGTGSKITVTANRGTSNPQETA